MGRPEPLHTAAFLVDQNGIIISRAEDLADIAGQRPDLLRGVAVALEQDDAARPVHREEGAFGGSERPAGQSADEGARTGQEPRRLTY